MVSYWVGGFQYFIGCFLFFFILFGRFWGCCCSSAVLRVSIAWALFWGSKWVELG